MHISLDLSTEDLHISHFNTSLYISMTSSVNNKHRIEPAKHISERVRKLLHQAVAVGARESHIENRTRCSKIKSIGIIISRNYPITNYYEFSHDKNNQSDNNYNFSHGKNNQPNHNYRFLHVSHPCNYGLIAFLETNQIQVILYSM